MPRDAEGELDRTYGRLKDPSGHVDNILKAHSLRPHTLTGHMTLYKSVLHHPRNTIPKWFLECIGVFTSQLNACDYCVDHHTAGMVRLLADESRGRRIVDALATGIWADVFDTLQKAALNYARQLTQAPATIREADIEKLRAVGWDDGEILELNQVVAYFCYANRTVLGLGVSVAGEVLGLSPNDSSDAENWSHR